MSVLYLLSAGSSVRKDGGRILAEKDGKPVGSIPVRNLETVIVSEKAHVSTAALFFLMEHAVPVFFIDWAGQIQGQITKEDGSFRRLLDQVAYFRDAEKRLGIIRDTVAEKIGNQRHILQQYAASLKNAKLDDAAKTLKIYQKKIPSLSDEEQLRGMEGSASRCYFGAFPLLLDQSKWKWKGRSQHPAKDPANALLNYGYAFLEREVRVGIASALLDARIGFFHANNGRKDSLVFDIMELFRQPVIDRFVLSLLNRNTVKPEHFEPGQGGMRLTEEGRGVWCARYELYMEKPYQAYDGKTSRQWIRARIRQFAQGIRQEAPCETMCT